MWSLSLSSVKFLELFVKGRMWYELLFSVVLDFLEPSASLVVQATTGAKKGLTSGQMVGKLPHRRALNPSMIDQMTTSTLSPTEISHVHNHSLAYETHRLNPSCC